MSGQLFRIHTFFVAKNVFVRFNKFLNHISLRGLGVLNCENNSVSGEKKLLKKIIVHKNMTVIVVGANIGNYSINSNQLQLFIHLSRTQIHL